MAQYNYLKNNFTAGKVNRKVAFRSDLIYHKNGCLDLQNFLPMSQGGVRRRPGTKFLVEVKDSSKRTRLVDFQSSVTNSYIIEMGEQYFRFIKNRAQLGAPYEVAHVYSEDEIFDVKTAQSVDVMYMVHGSYPVKQLVRSADTSWAFSNVEFVDGPYQDIQIGGTTLTLSATSGTITVTASAALFAATDSTGGSGTGAVDRHIRIKDANGTDWLPCKITSYTSSTSVQIQIQDVPGFRTSFTSVANPLDTFQLGAFSSTTGFPKRVCFYENRLVFANTTSEPETIWASRVDDYTRFSPDDADDDAVSFIAVAERLNAIQWMSPNKTLRTGSNGAEFDLSGGSTTLSIGPNNIRIIRTTNYGSSAVDPIIVDSTTLFWQRGGRVLREYTYSYEQDNFVASDLTRFSDDICYGGALEMAYQLEPDNVVWVVTSDGALISLTFVPSERVAAWAEHPMSGTDTAVKSIAVIPSTREDELYLIVSRTIDGSTVQYIEYMDQTFFNQSSKEAYFVDCGIYYTGETPAATLTPGATTGTSVTFTAGSSVFASTDVGRHIRYGDAKAIITAYSSGTVVTADITVDFPSTSAIASGDWTLSTDTITGLDHLEGETITACADGGAHPDVTVSGGEAVLNGQYTFVAIGYNYISKFLTVPVDYASNTGTQLGNRSRITEATLSVFESVGGKLGKDFNNLRPIYATVAVFGEGEEPSTLDRVVRVNHVWSDEATIAVQQDQPLPMTVVGLVLKMETSEAR